MISLVKPKLTWKTDFTVGIDPRVDCRKVTQRKLKLLFAKGQ